MMYSYLQVIHGLHPDYNRGWMMRSRIKIYQFQTFAAGNAKNTLFEFQEFACRSNKRFFRLTRWFPFDLAIIFFHFRNIINHIFD